MDLNMSLTPLLGHLNLRRFDFDDLVKTVFAYSSPDNCYQHKKREREYAPFKVVRTLDESVQPFIQPRFAYFNCSYSLLMVFYFISKLNAHFQSPLAKLERQSPRIHD